MSTIYYLTLCSHSLWLSAQSQWSRNSVGDVFLLPRPRQDILGAAALRGQSSLTLLSGRIYFLRFFLAWNPTSPLLHRSARLICKECVHKCNEFYFILVVSMKATSLTRTRSILNVGCTSLNDLRSHANNGTRITKIQKDVRYVNRKSLNMHNNTGVLVSWTYCPTVCNFCGHVLKWKLFIYLNIFWIYRAYCKSPREQTNKKLTRSQYQQMAP